MKIEISEIGFKMQNISTALLTSFSTAEINIVALMKVRLDWIKYWTKTKNFSHLMRLQQDSEKLD